MTNIILQLSLISLLPIIFSLEKCCFPKLRSSRQQLVYFIFWNGSIRIFLELFLELFLFSLLNLAELESDSGNEGIEASN